MPEYEKGEARTWARENLVGVSGVTIPTFTADLTKLNPAAIAHDIDLLARLGYDYTLVMSEINITPEENAEFTAIAREASGGRMRLFFHAAFGTLADNIRAAQMAEAAGADLALLSYPPQFWPTSQEEIYDYTRAFCDNVSMGVMLFPIPLWGFERTDVAGMPVAMVRRLLDDCPNIVAIKSEQAYPYIPGMIEMYHHFRDEVIISLPIESQTIPLMRFMDLQFSGTSNTQWMGDYYPRAFAAGREGRWEEAMDLFWQVHPARMANDNVTTTYIGGTSVINRNCWKYQDWLAGFNGGPLRGPIPRIPDRHMKTLRAGLTAAGCPVTDSPDSEYHIGRNPA